MKTHLETTIELATKALQEQKYDKAEPLFREALLEAQERKNELVTATCLDNIGEIYFQQGYFEKAELYYQQAMEIRRRLLPPGHEDMIISLNNLSAAYFFQGKYRLAKPLCEQLIANYETILGRDHPEIATCFINLGLIAMAEGKLGNAEKRFADAHAIRNAFYEPMNVLIGNSLGHLGNVYFEQGRYELANETWQQALNILEKQLSPEDPDLEKIVSKHIIALERTGKFGELEQLYPRRINAIEIKLGPAHPEVAKYLDKLANLYLKQNKYEEAERIFQRLLSMKRRAHGNAHPEVANQLSNLASVRNVLKQPGQAETLFLQAINIYENYKGKNTTQTSFALSKYLETIQNLGVFYDQEKRFAKSEKQWQQYLLLIEPQSRKYPHLVLEAYQQLANSLYEQNKFSEAELLLRKALSFLEECSSGESKQMNVAEYKLQKAIVTTKLAQILKAQLKYSEAESHYQQALDSLMKLLGSNHPDLAPTLEGYADLLAKTYREAEAEHMLSCAKNLLRKA